MTHKRYRSKDNLSYTIGVYPTIELLKNRPDIVERILVSSKGQSNKGLQVIRDICGKESIEIVEADAQIRRSANEKTYAMGIFRKYSKNVSDIENHIILVSPKHQGNLGTILRTMAGLGFHDLAIIGEAADIFDPNTIRSSMGAIFRINFTRYSKIKDYLTDHPGHTLYPFMTVGRRSLKTTTFKEPYALVFGNEGEGLPEEYAELGTPVRIEQSDEIDSLNLAVSVGIAMYAARTATSSRS